MEIGSRVRYIHIDSEEKKETGYYPPIGTLGTVLRVYSTDIFVKWDNGTKGDGEWFCMIKDVEEVANMDRDKRAVYDLVKNYFHDCEMNGHSEFEMWCEDNIENEEQRRLFNIINDHVEAIADTLFN